MQIEFSISHEEDMYSILCSNTISESVLADNPNLHSTKPDKNEHGVGTRIIKDIAKKYNGTCIFYEQGNRFNCKVVLRV